MRKLATVRKIAELRPIEGADSIECAIVGGWQCVVKKGEFHVGDIVVYLEVDSWVPHALAPFLSKGKEPREFNGVKGERLRTVKLRGQLSQGLVLPISDVMPYFFDSDEDEGQEPCEFFTAETDVTDLLGIVKYEPPMPAQLAGKVKGTFPGFIPKTDQERIQNLKDILPIWVEDFEQSWEVTEKLDGSSMTVFYRDGDVGVCSRNLELVETEDNSFWRTAKPIIEKLKAYGKNIALQGELIGEGIQKNRYGIQGHKFLLFDIYGIDEGEYLGPFLRRAIADKLDIEHVPVVNEYYALQDDESIDSLLQKAEGGSLLNGCEREGLVFKSNIPAGPTFKAISNKFLLKGGE